MACWLTFRGESYGWEAQFFERGELFAKPWRVRDARPRRAMGGAGTEDDGAMTVITTVITKHYCVVASDSRLSYENEPRDQWPPDEAKLIPAARWRGAMAYWGVVSTRDNSWSTKGQLLDVMANAPDGQSAEALAQSIADRLNEEFARRKWSSPDRGLGIHFFAYERDATDDALWIPELFVITNWKDTPEDHYSRIKGWQGFEVTRESYQAVRRGESKNDLLRCSFEEQKRPENRRAVYRALHETDLLLYFNNGDPVTFAPIANFVFARFIRMGLQWRRENIKEGHRLLAREPIEILTQMSELTKEPSKQIIGGMTHDLTISPDGTIDSHCNECGDPFKRERISK